MISIDEVVDDLVVERIHFFALPEALVELVVHLLLHVQRVDERIRVDEELENRMQHLADEAQRAAMRVVERRVLELVLRRLGAHDAMPA